MNNIFITLLTLAVFQGVSEFIPISSSGHLVIFESVPFFRDALKSTGNDLELFVNVSLHVATLIAVLIFLWKDIAKIALGVVSGIINRDFDRSEIKSFINIIAACLPAGIAGILFHDFFKILFSSVTTVFFMLIINGFILLSTKIVPIKNRKLEEIGLVRSFLIGFFQLLAIIPGISRSGSTITGGMIIGLAPEESAKFSFLMAVPVIAGAGLLETLTVVEKNIPFDFLLPLSISMALTMIVGLISLKILFSLVRRIRIDVFGYYTLLLGILGLFFLHFAG